MQIEYYGWNLIEMNDDDIKSFLTSKAEEERTIGRKMYDAYVKHDYDEEEKLVEVFKALLSEGMHLADYLLIAAFKKKRFRLFHFLMQQTKYMHESTARRIQKLAEEKNSPIGKIELSEAYSAMFLNGKKLEEIGSGS